MKTEDLKALVNDDLFRYALERLVAQEVKEQMYEFRLEFTNAVEDLKHTAKHIERVQDELNKAGFINKLDVIIDKIKAI